MPTDMASLCALQALRGQAAGYADGVPLRHLRGGPPPGHTGLIDSHRTRAFAAAAKKQSQQLFCHLAQRWTASWPHRADIDNYYHRGFCRPLEQAVAAAIPSTLRKGGPSAGHTGLVSTAITTEAFAAAATKLSQQPLCHLCAKLDRLLTAME